MSDTSRCSEVPASGSSFILQTIWVFPGDASKSWMLVTSQLVSIWSSNIYLLHKLPHHWASIACGFQASHLLWNSAAFKITSSKLNTFALNLSKAEKMNWLQVGSCYGLCLKYSLCCCDTVPVTLSASASSGRQVMGPVFWSRLVFGTSFACLFEMHFQLSVI